MKGGDSMVLKCPYCNSTNIIEIKPEEDEKFIISRVKDKGDEISRPVGGITVHILGCEDCGMYLLHS
jgi:phage FluMu protein Com